MKGELPWLFGKGDNGEEFNKEKKSMEMQEQVMSKGFEVADKMTDRLGKGADRLAGIGEKIVESSLKRAEHQEYADFTDDDMEEMYKRIRGGDEDAFYGKPSQEQQPQMVQYKDLEIEDIDDPEAFYTEQPQPQPYTQPQPPLKQEVGGVEATNYEPTPEKPKKQKDPMVLNMGGGY
jgi:hypothetical protein